MCNRAIRIIRWLLWAAVICLGLPVTLQFGVYALWVIANGLDGAGLALCLGAAMELLPMGVCVAAAVTVLMHLKGRSLPKWWWIGLVGMLALAWAVSLTAAATSAFPGQNAAALAGSAIMLLLQTLYSLLSQSVPAAHQAPPSVSEKE